MWNVISNHVMHRHDGDVSSVTLLMAFHIITATGFAYLTQR